MSPLRITYVHAAILVPRSTWKSCLKCGLFNRPWSDASFSFFHCTSRGGCAINTYYSLQVIEALSLAALAADIIFLFPTPRALVLLLQRRMSCWSSSPRETGSPQGLSVTGAPRRTCAPSGEGFPALPTAM